MEVLKLIADNPALLNALKGLLQKHFSVDTLSTNMTNENMGQLVRSRLDGLEVLERAFKEIERHRTQKDKPLSQNPAR